jgi:hypothetical protein
LRAQIQDRGGWNCHGETGYSLRNVQIAFEGSGLNIEEVGINMGRLDTGSECPASSRGLWTQDIKEGLKSKPEEINKCTRTY